MTQGKVRKVQTLLHAVHEHQLSQRREAINTSAHLMQDLKRSLPFLKLLVSEARRRVGDADQSKQSSRPAPSQSVRRKRL